MWYLSESWTGYYFRDTDLSNSRSNIIVALAPGDGMLSYVTPCTEADGFLFFDIFSKKTFVDHGTRYRPAPEDMAKRLELAYLKSLI